MPTHPLDRIHNNLVEDFHDKKEERTNIRRYKEMEATMKRMRGMEELPSPYQQLENAAS